MARTRGPVDGSGPDDARVTGGGRVTMEQALVGVTVSLIPAEGD